MDRPPYAKANKRNRVRVGFLGIAGSTAVALLGYAGFRHDTRATQPNNPAIDRAMKVEESVGGMPTGAAAPELILTEFNTSHHLHIFDSHGEHNGSECAVLVFISSACAGCARDVPLWKDLLRECSQRSVAFYIVALDSDREEIGRFASLFDFADLPLLYDGERTHIGRLFSVNIIPSVYVFKRSVLKDKFLGLTSVKNGIALEGTAKLRAILDVIQRESQ